MSDKKMTWLEHEEAAEEALALAIRTAGEGMSSTPQIYAAIATAHATLALIRMPQ